MTTELAIDRVVQALHERGRKVTRGRNGNLDAQCPAHDDRSPSLSLRQIDGQVLLRCHREPPCETADVVAAIGLTMRDLFDDRRGVRYEYTDATGQRTRTVYRSPNKDFRQSGKTKFKELYRLPRVIDAVARGQLVWLAEGEKDVHALESVGELVVATTAPEGAGNFDKADVSPLKGARVRAVVDRDAAGQKWAAEVQRRLDGYAAELSFVEAKTGKDAADHVLAGHSLEDFTPIEVTASEQTETTDEQTQPTRRAQITWASEIEPRPVVWAWEDNGNGRIPAGSLSAAAGREGTGKSSFGIWLAARITTGTLPGAFYRKPRRVLYVAVEDSWEHTLVPRLMAAGAELSMVGRFEVVTDEGDDVTLSLPVDNALLERAITDHDIALVVIDPLMSVISERVDTHRERDVRTALDPLAKLANRTGAIILGIAHFNKGAGTDAASLITGSGAFKNVPRSIFGFAKDEASETGSRVMTQVKNSLGICDELPSLGYVIESAMVDTPTGIAVTGRFRFTGESDRSVHDVLRDARSGIDEEDRAEQADAAKWLAGYLEDNGGEAEVLDVIKAGAKVGFSKDALKRVKKKAGVVSRKEAMDAGWMWVLAEAVPPVAQRSEGSEGSEGSEERSPLEGTPFAAPFGDQDDEGSAKSARPITLLPSRSSLPSLPSDAESEEACVGCFRPTSQHDREGKPRCARCMPLDDDIEEWSA